MKSSIAEYYAHKSLLVTGASGFIGKVLIEKLLRSCPRLDKIYVLLRPGTRNGRPVEQRMADFRANPVFQLNNLSMDQLTSKLVAIEGDLTQPNLGISESDHQRLVENVSIVFHVAATVSFNGPLKNFIDQNVLGTKSILELAEKMVKLEVSSVLETKETFIFPFLVLYLRVDSLFQL